MEFIAGGGGNEIGASFYVTILDDGTVIAVDCGARPSAGFNPEISVVGAKPTSKEYRAPEPDFSVVSNVDFLLLTHGHLDHVLMVPVLARLHPSMQIMATAPTKALCEFHWSETIKLAERKHIASPFSSEEVKKALERIQIIEPSVDAIIHIQLTDRLSIAAIPAGHILGAVSYAMYENGQIIGFYTGDYTPFDQHTVKGAPLLYCDDLRFMVTASTHLTDQNKPREVVENKFVSAIQKASLRGMSIRILGFAIGRSQETYQLIREAIGVEMPVYLEGSAKTISNIYLKYSPDGLIDPHIQESYVSDWEQRRSILAAREPNIVIIPTAMQFGGFGEIYAGHGVARNDHLFMSVGWLDPCSPEYTFFGDHANVLRIRNRTIPVLCQRERFSLTAHCDGDDVLAMHDRMHPNTTVLIHGDDTRMDQFLAQHPGKGFVKGSNGTFISL